jgi:ubiquinone/menaquinone biosynthesis C-methylase UbiE
MAPLAGMRVLEIGAGLGVNTLQLAGRGARVVATDISLERLRALDAVARASGAGAAVMPVRCAAEALPFRRDAFDRACTKSVLIHTRISEAAAEAARVLSPGGRGVFIEPRAHAPLVNLYRRTLAPREWRTITTYFTDRESGAVMAPFASGEERRFYLVSFAAFLWQFGVRAPRLFRVSLAVLHALDRALFGLIPPLRRLAWFAAIRVDK